MVAILCDEPTAPSLRQKMAQAETILMPAPVYLEAGIVLLRRRGEGARMILDEFLKVGQIDIMPIGEAETRIALNAFAHYGKGRGHRAQLNFGDCQVYGVAKVHSLPLLFVGDDFAATDIADVRTFVE